MISKQISTEIKTKAVRYTLALGGAILMALANIAGADETIELQGNAVQGGLLFGQAPAGVRVYWAGREVRTTPEGKFVLGLGRDNRELMVLRFEGAEGVLQQRVVEVAQREYPKQYIKGIASKIMNPDEAALAHIRKDSAEIGVARKVDSDRTDFLQAFEWPLEGPITGVFGSQRVYNGVPKRPHYGVDVAAPTGTPVVAPVDGVITLANPDMFYSGGTLMIDHGYGLSSSFLHLSRILVAVGDEVRQGQVVAEVGATGRVTGAHLDWRMNWYDQRIDPQLLVGPMPQPGGESADKTGSEND